MALSPNNRGQVKFSGPTSFSECWLDIDDPFLVSTSYTDAQKQTLVIRACNAINRRANAFFNKQEADEIFINDSAYYFGYQTYGLKNRPVNSITDLYLQVADSFVEISLDYIQEMDEAGVLKVLPVPQQQQSLQISLLKLREFDKLNLWVRYDSGYDPNDIPEDIVMATVLMYNYYTGIVTNPSGATEFKTQTYSEKAGTSAKDNAVFAEIDQLLSRYYIPNVV